MSVVRGGKRGRQKKPVQRGKTKQRRDQRQLDREDDAVLGVDQCAEVLS